MKQSRSALERKERDSKTQSDRVEALEKELQELRTQAALINQRVDIQSHVPLSEVVDDLARVSDLSEPGAAALLVDSASTNKGEEPSVVPIPTPYGLDSLADRELSVKETARCE